MMGRGALADPLLPRRIAAELGVAANEPELSAAEMEWRPLLQRLVHYTELIHGHAPRLVLGRLKQWLKLASAYGNFAAFDAVKRAGTVEELFSALEFGGCKIPAGTG
jgi:tRNA-dihydrouridine synthase